MHDDSAIQVKNISGKNSFSTTSFAVNKKDKVSMLMYLQLPHEVISGVLIGTPQQALTAHPMLAPARPMKPPEVPTTNESSNGELASGENGIDDNFRIKTRLRIVKVLKLGSGPSSTSASLDGLLSSVLRTVGDSPDLIEYDDSLLAIIKARVDEDTSLSFLLDGIVQ